MIHKIGKGLKINCRDSEGMPHGIESADPERWLLGVQWHPELSADPINKRIFKVFVEKAKEYSAKKEFISLESEVLFPK